MVRIFRIKELGSRNWCNDRILHSAVVSDVKPAARLQKTNKEGPVRWMLGEEAETGCDYVKAATSTIVLR
jgi:hypothetical protein